MKILHCLVAGTLALGVLQMPSISADTDLENTDLARIVNVLNSLNPLIDEAERQQDKNARVIFQYDALRSDLNKIKVGIAQKLQTTSIEPREVVSIDGDYLKQRGKHL
jgi:RAQPRD family integrative conjugative element protein